MWRLIAGISVAPEAAFLQIVMQITLHLHGVLCLFWMDFYHQHITANAVQDSICCGTKQ